MVSGLYTPHGFNKHRSYSSGSHKDFPGAPELYGKNHIVWLLLTFSMDSLVSREACGALKCQEAARSQVLLVYVRAMSTIRRQIKDDIKGPE